jgi:AraC family transcriptional regulator
MNDSATGFAPITLGTCLRSETIGDLRIAEARAKPGRLPWHAHEHACLLVVLEGSFTEAFRTKAIPCDEATALFKPAGESHSNDHGGTAARFLVVNFLPGKVAHLREEARSLDHVANLRSGDVMQLGTRIFDELVRDDTLSPLVMEGLILELLATTFRHCGYHMVARPPRWLERTRERLHDEFASKLSIADIAADAAVHPDHLSRSFRQYYGLLIGEYVRRLRVEWASQRLAGTDIPLAQIAAAAGFSDQSEFTRRFREHTGTTPARYRKEHGAA